MDDLKEPTVAFIERISSHWVFDENHYPGALKKASEKDIRDFGFLHMVLHLAKEGGTLARIWERIYHRQSNVPSKRDLIRAKKIAMKTIVSGFRLFVLTGGSPEELEKYITRS